MMTVVVVVVIVAVFFFFLLFFLSQFFLRSVKIAETSVSCSSAPRVNISPLTKEGPLGLSMKSTARVSRVTCHVRYAEKGCLFLRAICSSRLLILCRIHASGRKAVCSWKLCVPQVYLSLKAICVEYICIMRKGCVFLKVVCSWKLLVHEGYLFLNAILCRIHAPRRKTVCSWRLFVPQ